MYPGQSMALRSGFVLIRGPQDVFSLQLQFLCDTKDLARYDTPAKLRQKLLQSMKPVLDQLGKGQDRAGEAFLRSFTPRGRFGYVMRVVDPKYLHCAPPPEEWKYMTSGSFRIGNDSVLLFLLLTNTVDDAEYCSLLDYVADFAIPEQGSSEWKVKTAKEAYQIAETEFAKRYPVQSINKYKPFSIKRLNKEWIVSCEGWEKSSDPDMIPLHMDGTTGRILSESPKK